MKKTLTLFLALILTMSCCSFAAAEEAPTTVSIALALNTNVVDYDTNAYTLALEKEFNVDIDFLLLEDIDQKLPVMVSSGSALPDMICCALNNNMIWNWAQQGVLAPLKQYWDNPELTTHLMSRVADLRCDPALVDEMLANCIMPDGEIYTLPSYDQNLWNLMPYRMRVNTQWLEQAGLEIPTTLDAFREMLVYFRDHDMNGNGDAADEIPLTGSSLTWGGSIEAFLLGSFIHANPSANYMNVENGRITPAYTQDAFREGLAYLHDMYAEGLIDPLCFTQDQTQMKAVINGDELLVGAVCCGSNSNFTTPETDAAYSIIAPLTGPNGVACAASSPASSIGKVYITCDAKDPELCFRMAEINYASRWRALFACGVEGENWTSDPEEIRQLKLTFSSGDYDRVLYAKTENIWGKVNNNIWNSECMPFFTTMENIINMVEVGKKVSDLTEEELNAISPEERHYTLYKDHQPAEMPGTLLYTSEELEKLADIQAAIDSYAKEQIMAFIVGNQSLDGWDAFQAELRKMGLEDYVSIMQAAYDRKTA